MESISCSVHFAECFIREEGEEEFFLVYGILFNLNLSIPIDFKTVKLREILEENGELQFIHGWLIGVPRHHSDSFQSLSP